MREVLTVLILFLFAFLLPLWSWLKRLGLQAEIRRLKLKVAELTGENWALRHAHEGMRELASQAIQLAQKRVAAPERSDPRSVRHLADYKPPSVQNCPKCFVSIRSDSWPQQCPACRTMFNADGSLDVLESGSLE